MVAAYSPHGEAGGTLHFPSSPHIRHVDGASSALQHLRRSLSRSPSKGPVFRLVTSKSASPSPSSPLSPSRISAPYRSASTSLLSGPNVPQPSPLAIPYPPSAKRNRSTARKLSPMRLASRSRSSPRSPGRTTLSDLSDHGNATPRSSAGSSDDGENRIDGDAVDENTSGTAKALHPVDGQDEIKNRENGCVVPRAFARFEKHNGNVGSFAAKSSPLKRSDGIMNLDQANPGSPSAKRRSLHGSTFGPDFDIFDHEAACQGMSEFPSSRDGSHTECSALADHANVVSPMPRRTSSLRRTTLQQRYDKPLWARSRLNADVALECVTPGQSAPKNRFRMSLENFLPSLPRDSPFSSQGSLPNASVHPMFKQGPKSSHLGHQDRPQRHPLSRTITQSSSNSSMTDESPTHMPLRPGEPRKPLADFSKSLPVGASRPGSREAATSTISCQATSTEASFSTPENYKLAKPLPAAFMSTGLISKRHKDMEDMQPSFQGGKSVMPDTPCKRQSLVGASPPTMAPEKQIPRTRHVRHSFGMPSTPFNPQPTRPEPGTFGKGVSIFGSSFKGNNINRRGSFLSINSDDHSQSPPAQSQSQSSHEYELPPTPTKQFTPLGDAHARRAGGSANEQDSRVRECGPTGGSKPQLSEARQNSSPISIRPEQISPHTPRENIIPPDPSGLSISAQADGQLLQPNKHMRSSASSFPPATPTASRDSFPSFGNGRLSLHACNNIATVDVDPCLVSKFDKVELVGTGEFSNVYRVTKAQEVSAASGYFSLQTTYGSPKTPLPDRVWAVKKTRQAYIGPKDRQRKLQEVTVLAALRQSDHIIHFYDSWEAESHLYIQTEFCEEGSLDLFLDQVGRKARLDDFRIWKIMLEMSLGLKYIHDSGFIHLDLKPANVLITFEGVLKISDFGMATTWPAPPGIDGEGDREYIGPEILMGHFDKPSDIFALGLIMLEIAGNVMLPDNGTSWQRLRSGDMSDVPSLTWSSDTSTIFRDASGKPVSHELSTEDFYASDSSGDDFQPLSLSQHRRKAPPKKPGDKFQLLRSGELAQPPSFMIDASHQEALDNVVRWMISPQSADRPVVDQILGTMGVRWAESRRRAGATIYEGNWGPADEVLADDAEMIDV